MDFGAIALFALTEFLLSLTPGPAVLLVMSLSMRQGLQAGAMASFGILTTNAVFFTLSALGVGALIVASSTLFAVVKWVGAAYLVYLGIGMVRPVLRRMRRQREAVAKPVVAPLAAATPESHRRARSAFWKGFILQASNPKNIAFFVAILPQFVSPEDNVPVQLLILGVMSVLIELPILLFYTVAFTLTARLMKDRVIACIEAIGGGILITLGLALARTERSS